MHNAAHIEKKSPWVCIIEDDVFINKAYTSKFAHENISIKIAEDGERGMQLLESNDKPSLILLDLMLPKKNGFEVLEEIKKNPTLKNIPVIIMTNLGQAADAKRGLALGAIEYLVKANIKIDEIIKKVKGYLSDEQ